MIEIDNQGFDVKFHYSVKLKTQHRVRHAVGDYHQATGHREEVMVSLQMIMN